MYKIYEVLTSTLFDLIYETNDLDFATRFLATYKTKYYDKKFVLMQEVL